MYIIITVVAVRRRRHHHQSSPSKSVNFYPVIDIRVLFVFYVDGMRSDSFWLHVEQKCSGYIAEHVFNSCQNSARCRENSHSCGAFNKLRMQTNIQI